MSNPATNQASSLVVHFGSSFNHLLAVKPDSNNFLLWKQQIIATIRGHRLMNYIRNQLQWSSVMTELLLLSSFCGVNKINCSLDGFRFGKSWYFTSSSYVSSFDVWSKIEGMFLSKTKASIFRYSNEFQNIKKGGMSMSEYLLRFKGLVDTLSYAGHLIIEEKSDSTSSKWFGNWI